jgi:hypothetical protein
MYYSCIIFEKNHASDNNGNIYFTIYLDKKEDIINGIYTHLCNTYHQESYDNMKLGLQPIVDFLHDKYEIKSLIQYEPKKCQGCVEDQPNQLAHIDCPDGCLHNQKTCTEYECSKQ